MSRALQRQTAVGAEWFHTVADRERAVTRLSADFQMLSEDLAEQISKRRVESNPQSDLAQSDAQWLVADVTPTLDEWNEFAEKEKSSWWTRAATSWEAFEEWQDRLKRLREFARARGILLVSPEPVNLPKTIFERAASGKGSEGATWLGILKIGVATAIGITGFVTLYSVLMHVKAGGQLTNFRHAKKDK